MQFAGISTTKYHMGKKSHEAKRIEVVLSFPAGQLYTTLHSFSYNSYSNFKHHIDVFIFSVKIIIALLKNENYSRYILNTKKCDANNFFHDLITSSLQVICIIYNASINIILPFGN